MRNILIFSLLFTLTSGFSQQQENCHDMVRLRNGSVFRGKITAYQIGGELVMTTWSGMEMRLPAGNVKRIRQYCTEEKNSGTVAVQASAPFEETGWYHASRVYALPGKYGLGYGLQHSSGYKLTRLFGFGAGTGVENFILQETDVATYPLFVEMRGYFSPRPITPFYALAWGWGFTGKSRNTDNVAEAWKGGQMMQGQIGYRVGNHVIAYVGVRLQRKTRTWGNLWWEGPTAHVDHIFQKRMEIGVGILL